MRQTDSGPCFHGTHLLVPQGTTKTSTDKCLGVSCPASTWVSLAGARRGRELGQASRGQAGLRYGLPLCLVLQGSATSVNITNNGNASQQLFIECLQCANMQYFVPPHWTSVNQVFYFPCLAKRN